MTATGDQMDYIALLQERLARCQQGVTKQAELIEQLEDVVHKATQLAAHIPYLCSDVEGSEKIEMAAHQLHHILIQRRM